MANDSNFRIDKYVDRPWPMNFLMTYNAMLATDIQKDEADDYVTIPDGANGSGVPPQDIEATIIYMLSSYGRKNTLLFVLGYFRDHISTDELAEMHGCTRANVCSVIRYWFEIHTSKSNRKLLTHGVSNLISHAKVPLSTTIDEMNLSIRTYHCVKRAGINTVGELSTRTKAEVKKFRNLGKKSFDELILKLRMLGYELPDREEEE